MTLTGAEILKLVRRRGLIISAALLTLGPVVVSYGVLVTLHAADPERWGPAGGAENLASGLGALALFVTVAAVIVSTTAGSQDRSSGVFRDLVVTGRSRTALFLARVSGALAVYLPLLAAALTVAVTASYVFAGSKATSGAVDLAGYAGWLGAATTLTIVLGVSLGSILSSRVAVGILLAWTLVLTPMLLGITELGGARAALGAAAAEHFAPNPSGTTPIAMSTGTALLVLALWLVIPLRVGASVTKRRDA
jgi:hypothetical protein